MRYPSYCMEGGCDRMAIGGTGELCHECTFGILFHECRYCGEEFETDRPFFTQNAPPCGDCVMDAATMIQRWWRDKAACKICKTNRWLPSGRCFECYYENKYRPSD